MNAQTNIKPAGPVYHPNLIQGSDEWLAARCGLICASEVKHLLTVKTLKVADNDKTRASTSGNCCFSGSPGMSSRTTSAMTCSEASRTSSMPANSTPSIMPRCRKSGSSRTTAGASRSGIPDALVGDDGLIECKSRRGKFQIQTIAENEVPEEYVLQLQTGLLVTGRKWIDFISYRRAPDVRQARRA
jgi:hypothetical protein